MNKKIIILSSVLTTFFVFILALIPVFLIQTKHLFTKKVFKIYPSIVFDYNKNITKTFPAPYEKVGGLPYK